MEPFLKSEKNSWKQCSVMSTFLYGSSSVSITKPGVAVSKAQVLALFCAVLLIAGFSLL